MQNEQVKDARSDKETGNPEDVNTEAIAEDNDLTKEIEKNAARKNEKEAPSSDGNQDGQERAFFRTR